MRYHRNNNTICILSNIFKTTTNNPPTRSEKNIDQILEEIRIASKSADEHLQKSKEAFEEYERLTIKYNLLEKEYKESQVTICPKQLPTLENLTLNSKEGKENTTIERVSLAGWKKYVEPTLLRYEGKQDFTDEDFRLDFLVSHSRAFEYDERTQQNKEWKIRLERSQNERKQFDKALKEFQELLKKPGVLDLLEKLETNPGGISEILEESYKKSIQYNPEDLKSQLQLEVYQLTNPLDRGWYPREQFYTELIQLIEQTAQCEDPEIKRKATTRYLNLLIGYSRNHLPQRRFQIPLLFSITKLGYSPKELKKMIIL